ncbi:hypothetical protein GLAREA_05974 [Glarea lozoyensis ATCC 20868]|uniref:Uncharacterized protein n=1 Tax=Glarea lozoyensis (strain ATCC 20868 / MF5171) TaxID=1116229 RepID=S3D391_GLAL2|nr:uncharacterized protein GLAREA_05974 [Glarea lozoyensis ATCC 20868]EPE32962.1 hypothetical protein GLAREA_05974 [Glarea lozoyensis ATCC 20868]
MFHAYSQVFDNTYQKVTTTESVNGVQISAALVLRRYNTAIWIDENPRVEKAFAISKAQERNYSSAHDSGSCMHHASQLKRRSKIQPVRSISSDIPLVGFKDPIILSFLAYKLAQGGGQLLRTESADKSTWVSRVSDSSKNTLNALASIIFGHVHRCSRMVEEGRKYYSKAVSDVRINLLDNAKMNLFDTLASVTVLCMYEIADRRSEIAWRYHADGLSTLIECSGPTLFQQYPFKSIFLEQRALMVSKAIFAGHGTFLSQWIWKNVPWENDLTSKEPLDYLFDILCDITMYLEESRKQAGVKPVPSAELEAKVLASLQQLDTWWKYWIRLNPYPCREFAIDSDSTLYTKDAEGVIFPTILVYNGLNTAYTLCTYNATRMLLLKLQETFPRSHAHPTGFESPNDPHSQVPLLGLSSDYQGLAYEIFRSAEYLHVESDQFMVSFTSMFIFDIAYSALDPKSREAKWLLSKVSLPMRSMHGKGETFAKAITVLPTCQLLQPL